MITLKKIMYRVLAVLCTLIGIYPVIYLINDGNIGLLASKSQELLESILWQISFYAHIIPGGVALLIGWIQLNAKFRVKRMRLHRNIGKVYVLSAFVSGISGVYLGIYAEGGLISQLGFIGLGLSWIYYTYQGYRSIRRGDIPRHKSNMVYSYAVCFAAVALRLWMPILVMVFQDQAIAFQIVAWWCWVPNLFVARYLILKKGPTYSV